MYDTVLILSKIENLLVNAAAARLNFSGAVRQMVEAHKLAGEILKDHAIYMERMIWRYF